MQYKAKHKYADMSPRKIRPFATLIRGRTAEEALELLRFVHNRSARLLEQVVKSALGNAEFRGARDIEELIVSESRVDGGPIMKRIMPRARGTAYPIKRRIAHIHVTLSDGQAEPAE
ncbi:MAG: 50S ribosomal protein L22 [Planctomycetes bacterium]|nr:50S ribosomal protein L22 [Planctomycetota bacterium]NBY00758.1 50S ribosomal protein L22 [Planctomycetota bacterium]